jgi:hypothetical protein
MASLHVRKPTNFLFNILSGGCCGQYLAIAVFVGDVNNLFGSFNGGTCVDPGKTLCFPLSNNSPHIDHWKEADMGINSWIFLKDGKPTFCSASSITECVAN